MDERQRICGGLSSAAWGYLFLNLDINLGRVSILPRFVGWLLLLSAVKALKEERRDLGLLRPLGILMAVWTALDWGASWLGTDIDGVFLPVDLLVAVAQLYFLFQFLTDLAALAEAYLPEDDGRAVSGKILKCRSVQTVMVTGFALASYVTEFPETAVNGVVAVLAVGYCVLGVYLMMTLFTLRKYFRDEAPG